MSGGDTACRQITLTTCFIITIIIIITDFLYIVKSLNVLRNRRLIRAAASGVNASTTLDAYQCKLSAMKHRSPCSGQTFYLYLYYY